MSELQKFRHSRDGNVALIFALTAPLLIAAAGLGIDFQARLAQKAGLQDAADTLALRGARELLIDSSSPQLIEALILAVADKQFREKLGDFTVAPVVDGSRKIVTVTMTQPSKDGFFLSQIIPHEDPIVVDASAQSKGVTNVCVISLEPVADYAVRAMSSAKLTAPKCAVLSNSTSTRGISVTNLAKITSNMICSGGGYAGGVSNYSQLPITDSPAFEDPLAERVAPSAGACDEVGMVLGQQVTLSNLLGTVEAARIAALDASNDATLPGHTRFDLEPGVYCGGLEVNSDADVHLAPGIYVIKDGPLNVDLGARLHGENVGFYLTGDKATFRFGFESLIYLTAPKTGLMAGVLFFEDRAAPANRNHIILSSNARTLLGTIYLPRGILNVAALQPVADASAYTALVVNRLTMAGSPTLALNANYSATDIPVPEGVGPTGGQVFLRE